MKREDVMTTISVGWAGILLVAISIVTLLLVAVCRRIRRKRFGDSNSALQVASVRMCQWPRSDQERELVQMLRKRVLANRVADGLAGGERWYEDVELLRYVRAKKTLDESEALFRQGIAWRLCHAKAWGANVALGSFGTEHGEHLRLKCMNKVSTVPDWWTFLDDHMHTAIYGADRDGLPITYFAIGVTDVQGCVREVGFDAMLRYCVSQNDSFLDAARSTTQKENARTRSGDVVLHGGVVIIDLEGLSLRHVGNVTHVKKIAAVAKLLHPERQRRLFIVRAPRAFAAVWRLIQPIIDPRTAAKITIIGNNGSLQVLVDELGRDQVPQFLGGSCTLVPQAFAKVIEVGAYDRWRSATH